MSARARGSEGPARSPEGGWLPGVGPRLGLGQPFRCPEPVRPVSTQPVYEVGTAGPRHSHTPRDGAPCHHPPPQGQGAAPGPREPPCRALGHRSGRSLAPPRRISGLSGQEHNHLPSGRGAPLGWAVWGPSPVSAVVAAWAPSPHKAPIHPPPAGQAHTSGAGGKGDQRDLPRRSTVCSGKVKTLARQRPGLEAATGASAGEECFPEEVAPAQTAPPARRGPSCRRPWTTGSPVPPASATVGRPRGLRPACWRPPARHTPRDLCACATRAQAAPGAAGQRPPDTRRARPPRQTLRIVDHQSLDTESNVFREAPRLYLARWFVHPPSVPEPASDRTGPHPDPSPRPRPGPEPACLSSRPVSCKPQSQGSSEGGRGPRERAG